MVCRVMQLVVDDGGNTISYEPFIQGFLTQSTGNVWGEPLVVTWQPSSPKLCL